jgi:hypothetical protein
MDDFRIIRMAYIHELGHWYNKDLLKLRVRYPVKTETPLGACWNIIEDEVDERNMAKRYPGDAKALGEGHAILLGRQIEKINKRIKEEGIKEIDEEGVKRLACMMLAKTTRDWDAFVVPVLMTMRRKISEDAWQLCVTLVNEGWGAKIRKVETAEEVRQLAMALQKRLWPEQDPEQQMAEAEAKGKGEGNGESEGEGEGDSEGENKGKGDPTKGTNLVKSVIHWSDITYQDHNMPDSKHTSSINWDGKAKYRAYKPATENQFQILKIHE